MRLILIIICGVALIGAAWAYSNNDRRQAGEAEIEEVYRAPARVKKVETVGRVKVDTGTNTEADTGPVDSARAAAKSTVGKDDPFAAIDTPLKPFPSGSNTAVTRTTTTATARRVSETPKTNFVPPPPAMSPGIVQDGFAGASGLLPSGLSASDLPEPPERPSTAKQLKLTAIMGDRAIFAARDLSIRRNNNWPSQITLAPGDMFGTLKLIATSREGAMVEEHGERFEIELPPVR